MGNGSGACVVAAGDRRDRKSAAKTKNKQAQKTTGGIAAASQTKLRLPSKAGPKEFGPVFCVARIAIGVAYFLV